MKKPVLAVRPYRHSKTYPWILDLRAYRKNGDKGRLFFKTKAEAEAECRRQKALLERHSREAVGLSQRMMSEIIGIKDELAKYGKTLSDAAKYYIDHLERVRRCNVTVRELADEVLKAKRQDGRAPKYIDGLRLYFKRFCQDFADRLIAGITVEELDNWLRALPVSPKTRTDYRSNIGVLFSYAAQRRMIELNPVKFTAKPKLIDRPPEIFTVNELTSLLEAAQRTEPTVLPMLAIGAFAGLRDAEIKRLHWNEVNLARGFIEVTALKAKSARRRIVPIQPNLAAWLRPYTNMEGPVSPEYARGKLERVRKSAKLMGWPKNGLRHSFASYRLAAIDDAPRVAAELGHTTPQLLYGTYRELVHPGDAESYWKITPAAEAANVMLFAKAAN